MNYSGADWIKKALKDWNLDVNMSPLGINVADLLGELYYGIYHIEENTLRKVVWHDKRIIIIRPRYQTLATIDFDYLTRLVFLAHHRAIRVEINAYTFTHLELMFSQRGRGDDKCKDHPTLDQAVARFKAMVSLPEYTGIPEDIVTSVK